MTASLFTRALAFLRGNPEPLPEPVQRPLGGRRPIRVSCDCGHERLIPAIEWDHMIVEPVCLECGERMLRVRP